MANWKEIVSAILYGFVGIISLLFFMLLFAPALKNPYYSILNPANIFIAVFFLIITVIYFRFARQASTAKPVDLIDLTKNISRGIVGFILIYFGAMFLFLIFDYALHRVFAINLFLTFMAIGLFFIIDAWIIFPFTHAITQKFFHITIGPKIRLAAFLIAIYLIFIFFPSTQAIP